MKLKILISIVVIIIIMIIFYKYNSENNNVIKCNMKFGLCPAAKCIPDPYDSTKAYCLCDVENGINYSYGNDNCEKIQPYNLNSGQEIIFSDFSPNIIKKGYHSTICPPEAVNLNCMNKICSVYPNDPSKAICICDKTNNKGLNWYTFNKNGESKTCDYQSGGSYQQHLYMSAFINKNS